MPRQGQIPSGGEEIEAAREAAETRRPAAAAAFDARRRDAGYPDR